jgi:malate permease and related proteins
LIEQFSITALQLLKFFSLIAFGYAARRKNWLPQQTGVVLSKLEVLLFLPALSFRTMSRNFRVSIIFDQGFLILISLFIVVVTFIIARFLSKMFTKDRNIREIYAYSFTIPNLGYLGYPLVLALFGEALLFRYMIYALPYQIFIYTVGITILNPKQAWTFRSIINPSMVALFLGIAVGLTGWTIPDIASETLSLAANCMGPVAMVLTGFILGSFAPRDLIGRWHVHVAAWIRLLAIPLCVFVILYFLRIETETIFLGTLLLSMPFGLNGVIFPQTHGGDSTEGAQMCFVSHAYSLVTLPLMIGLIIIVLGI